MPTTGCSGGGNGGVGLQPDSKLELSAPVMNGITRPAALKLGCM
jgi:hypothetical protein